VEAQPQRKFSGSANRRWPSLRTPIRYRSDIIAPELFLPPQRCQPKWLAVSVFQSLISTQQEEHSQSRLCVHAPVNASHVLIGADPSQTPSSPRSKTLSIGIPLAIAVAFTASCISRGQGSEGLAAELEYLGLGRLDTGRVYRLLENPRKWQRRRSKHRVKDEGRASPLLRSCRDRAWRDGAGSCAATLEELVVAPFRHLHAWG
jgi:hypothetical protein